MLDKKTLEELKQKLLDEKKQLENELAQLADKEGEGEYEAKYEDYGRTEEDNAEEVEAYTANISITETLEKNLKDVNDALKRMKNGKYGICEKCGKKKIRVERLKAYPAARSCIVCAEKK
ncbi:MAG: TraR/DksA C4-type zinc finger protein [Patescibacteria group bacterium]|nr:TraR/DksA C4-type zinc finger protein [Patescibacteria group bacterium]